MKKFYIHTIVIIALFLSMAFVLDIVYSNNLRLTDTDISDEKSVWNDIYSSKLNVDLAIYGSSRAWVHVDPEIMDSVLNMSTYNLGIDGYPFNMQYYRHKEYFKYNKKPKEIILLIDWHSLASNEGVYNSNQFKPYTLWNLNAMNHLGRLDSINRLDFFVPFFRYRGKNNLYREYFKKIKSSENKRKSGFRGSDKKWSNVNKQPFKIEIDLEVVEMLDEFLIDMKAQKINVIMVVAPYFIDGHNIVLNKRDHMGIIEKFAEEYSLPYLDYSNSALSHDKKYFYNNMHLNKKGARLFTLELANDIKELE